MPPQTPPLFFRPALFHNPTLTTIVIIRATLSHANMDNPMTPEERFTRIENFMDTMAVHQVRHDEDLRQLSGKIEILASQIGALASITTDLTGVSRHLINVQDQLVESNSLLRQVVESHAKRGDRRSGPQN